MLNNVVFDVSHMQKDGDFVYAVMKNGVKNVASYVGTAESVVIPADVVCIFNCAFAHTEHVREIVLRSENTVIFVMEMVSVSCVNGRSRFLTIKASPSNMEIS